MTRRFLAGFGVLALVVLGFRGAQADTYSWDMDASEDQINNAGTPDGSTDSTATGHATIDYDTSTGDLGFTISWDGLVALLTAIHIHGPAGPEASNPAHLWDLYVGEADVIAAGVNRTTDSVTMTVKLEDIVAATGAFDAATALRHMYNEVAYVNIHSQMWPMGEIRANFVLVSANIAQTPSHGRCMNALNKQLARVASAKYKAILRCFKTGGDVEACVAAPDSALSSQLFKTGEKFVSKCGGFDSNGALRYAPFGATEADTVNAAAVDGSEGLARDVFGVDFNAAISPAASKCQVSVADQLRRCQKRTIKEFNRCKKKGMAGKSGPPGADVPFDDETDLELCLGFDPDGRINKDCVTALDKKISIKCGTVDLVAAFPGCATADPGLLGDCIEQAAACRVCLAVNEADGLSRDCDLLDDTVANGSCSS